MTCDKALLLLSVRVDERLSAKEERKLEDHLSACQSCRAISEQLEELCGSFDGLEEYAAPEGFSRRVMETITGEEQTAPKVVPLFRRPGVRVLAGLAACLVLCVGLYRSRPDLGPGDGTLPFSASGVTERESKGVTDSGTCATLLLERLPEGKAAEHLDWTVEAGCRYAMADLETMEAVMALAEEQSIPLRLNGIPAQGSTVRIEIPAN